MTRLHLWLDGGVTVGMCRVGASCVGHGEILGIFTLGGAGAYGILGGGGGSWLPREWGGQLAPSEVGGQLAPTSSEVEQGGHTSGPLVGWSG